MAIDWPWRQLINYFCFISKSFIFEAVWEILGKHGSNQSSPNTNEIEIISGERKSYYYTNPMLSTIILDICMHSLSPSPLP